MQVQLQEDQVAEVEIIALDLLATFFLTQSACNLPYLQREHAIVLYFTRFPFSRKSATQPSVFPNCTDAWVQDFVLLLVKLCEVSLG